MVWLGMVAVMGCSGSDGAVISDNPLRTLDNGVEIREIWYWGDGLKLRAQLALPPGDGPHPVVFYNHGGFSGMGDNEMIPDVASFSVDGTSLGIVRNTAPGPVVFIR